MAHLGCDFLFLCPGSAGSCRVAPIRRSANTCKLVFVYPWGSCHTYTFRCRPICLSRVCKSALRDLLARHGWFTRVCSCPFLLAEKEVFLASPISDLKIDNIAHVFEIFQCVVMGFIFIIFLLFLIVLFLLLLLNWLLLLVYVLFFEISFKIAFDIFALKRLNCIILSINIVVVIWTCNSYSLHGQLI